MTQTSRQAVGAWGERLAARYLSDHGYTIMARNVRTDYGEIDLVARQDTDDGPIVIFVEVKTRTSTAFGPPEGSITVRKQAHMLAAAQAYLQANPGLENDWRIDVIAIQRLRKPQPPQIEHFENAITST